MRDLRLHLSVLPHAAGLRILTAISHNGGTKHLGQARGRHLVGIRVGGDPVCSDRSVTTVLHVHV